MTLNHSYQGQVDSEADPEVVEYFIHNDKWPFNLKLTGNSI